jgi:hypothetical protein
VTDFNNLRTINVTSQNKNQANATMDFFLKQQQTLNAHHLPSQQKQSVRYTANVMNRGQT